MRNYGFCPTQLEGVRLSDGAPFYFRSRSGKWAIEVGHPGDVINYHAWADNPSLTITGEGDINDPDTVDELVTKSIGSWRHVDQDVDQVMVVRRCRKCGNEFASQFGIRSCWPCQIRDFNRVRMG